MEREQVDRIRADYDRVAEEYADHLFRELEGKPLDRELLLRFVNAVQGRGEICDLGCGPGHIAHFLHEAGASVFGLDLSPKMIEQACRRTSSVRFEIGDVTALALRDGSLAGLVAFYSIVNIPFESLPRVFGEMHRVLQPSGLLLLAFHVGEERVHPGTMWEKPVDLDFYFFQPRAIAGLLERAGFSVGEILQRDPYAPEVEHQSRRAYIFAQKP